MRIIANIPHPRLKISIFLYNEKYIIEIEAAQYKQTFKISADSVTGVDDVKALITPELLEHSMDRFEAMHADFKNAFESIKK
jgi:hypothetical protein